MHQFMQLVVLPDKDIVPTRTRWRDDKLIVQLGIGGSPRPFNKLLTDAKIPLSQSGSD